MGKVKSNAWLRRDFKRKPKSILLGCSALMALSVSMPAYGQDIDPDDEIVSTGIRSSIKSAQDLKRNADTFLDAVTADDIGALSDRSIAEALQRVPGVSVSNFAGPSDPDHFSIEGSGVVIRGLNLTRSELNGRDIFSSGVGRSIDFQDFPSELVGAIEVFKNSSADQIEGGLSGTVNLKTRKPFDSPGRVIAGSLEFNHSDLQDQQDITPGGSLLLSDRWTTGIGEIGLLVGGSFSRLVSESNGSQIAVNRNILSGGASGEGGERFAGVLENDVQNGIFGGRLPNRVGDDTFSIIGAGIRSEERERERYGFNAALQWESKDERTVATAEFLRTDATLSWAENVIEPQTDAFAVEGNTGGTGGTAIPIDAAGQVLAIGNNTGFLSMDFVPPTSGVAPNQLIPVDGTFLELDESGQFQAGVLTSAASGWRGIAPVAPGSCPSFFCDGSFGTVNTQLVQPSPFLTTNRGRDESSDVSNYALNIQHEFNDNFRGELDGQYIRANNDVFDGSANFAFFANTFLDLNDGGIPDIQFLPGTNIQNPAEGPLSGISFGFGPTADNPQSIILPDAEGNLSVAQQAQVNSFFADPNNYFFRSTLRFIEESDTEEFAIESNFEYDVNHDWVTVFKFGARFSDRDQIARATRFTFGFVNEIFNGDIPLTAAQINDLTNDPDSALFGLDNVIETFNFDGLQRGDVPNPGSFVFAGDLFRSNGIGADSPLPAALLELQEAFPGIADVGGGDLVATELDDRVVSGEPLTGLIPGSPFTEGEIAQTSEEIFSAYLLTKFEKGPISGNVGVRWVRTNVESTGNQNFAAIAAVTPELLTAVDANGDPLIPPGTVVGTPIGCVDTPTPPSGDVMLPDGTVVTVPDNVGNDVGIDSALCALPVDEQIAVASFFGPDVNVIQSTTRNVENIFLPSFNVKYDLGGDKLFRFAASRTLFRPDFSLLRNNVFISQDTDPNGGGFRIRSDGGNPFLNPITSINLDGSFEWYFADAGSFTVSAFWKRLNNIIQQGEAAGPEITSNGVTFAPELIAPTNAASGSLRGVEIGYRQFYDFLPGPLAHIGFEGTYTFVDQSSIPSPGVEGGLGTDGFSVGPATGTFAISDLEGLSRHTINATGIYENDSISARLTYNWRSQFLLTVRDVITPNLPIFNEAQGSLDGSIFFNVTDNIKLGVQAVNLTNRTIRTSQQVSDDGALAPRSFFTNDRRFTAALRFTF